MKDTRDYGIIIKYFSKSMNEIPYDVDMEVRIDSDATAQDAILAFLKVLETATYHIDYTTLMKLAEDMRDGWR